MKVWLCGYDSARILQSPSFQEISRLTYEVSSILYIRGKIVISLSQSDLKGDSSGVKLPSVELIKKMCDQLSSRQVIFLHNHPYVAGRCSALPSGLDIATTKRYLKWLWDEGIELIDHIILSPEGFYSFLSHGKVFKAELNSNSKNQTNLIH
jgi:DNA repair protein RadC